MAKKLPKLHSFKKRSYGIHVSVNIMVIKQRFKLDTRRAAVIKEVLRFLTHACFVYLTAESIKWSVAFEKGDTKFSEYSFVEYGQSFLLLLSLLIALSFYFSKSCKSYKNILLLFAGLSSIAFIREQDIYFEQFRGHGVWPIPVLVIICIVAYKAFKARNELWTEVTLYVKTKSYAFFTFGTLTIFIFSRLFGRAEFWQLAMEDKYFRSVKNIAEESLELYGYLFFVFAIVELIILIKERSLIIVTSK
jgi:hypothetical protein